MIFYGSYKARNATGTPILDYIEFEFPSIPEKFLPEDLENEDIALSSFWDESDWFYDPETGEGSFRCKGVYLNDIYANGHIDIFRNAIVREYQVYGVNAASDFELTELEVEDGLEKVFFAENSLKRAEIIIEGR